MPENTDPRRDRPVAGQSGSTSAAFSFATETTQDAQPTPPRNGGSVNPGTNLISTVPQPTRQSSAATKPTSNKNADRPPLTSAGRVQNEIDQLESEVVHYMNISMEEKEKAEALSGRLDTVTQEKKDLERQIDDLDQELSRDGWLGQDDGASATGAGDAVSRVSAKIAALRTAAQKLEGDFNALTEVSNQRADTIADLQQQLRNKKEQLLKKTQEEDRLRKQLELMKETLTSEKKKYDKLLSSMKTLEQQGNGARAWADSISQKLAEVEETRDSLSGVVKRKTAQIEALLAGAAQVGAMRQKLDDNKKEIESLRASQKDLVARREKAEAVALQHSQTVSQLQAQLASQPQAQPFLSPQSEPADQQQQLLTHINDLTQALQRNQQRRMRAVGIGIDISGSAAGSLEVGIKRAYTHLLDTLQASPCKTYVMTAIHGPGDTVTVTSNFGDDWDTHKRVLDGRRADGVGRHVECLRKIKETAVEAGAVFDLQVVLLGDSDTNHASHVGMNEVCADFAQSNPPVLIHSVVVKAGSAGDSQTYRGAAEACIQWTPWGYVGATGGNMALWFQNDELPDLSDLVH